MTLGTLTLAGRAGANRFGFNGHLPSNRWLPLGRITVTAVAITARQRSTAHRLSFVVR
jgi:hypothetical protein